MTRYFCSIGNRDYLKLRGERRPFWDFLDEEPDGWLCSLAYRRSDVPLNLARIWDCGAWSYKTMDVPHLLGRPATPEYVLELYLEHAAPWDFVIAPDHILIPGLGDLHARRKFNRRSAERFFDLAGNTDLQPMATVHGETIEERIKVARRLIELGYRSLALGGLAGQAGRRRHVVEIVRKMRAEFPGVWMHVLGLSAPSFARVWHEIEIDSFDGASHFKQAFTAGKFFLNVGGKLESFNAVRKGEEATAPVCDCKACALLRKDGIDTRRYGSNESNMGRAAHNLNHLIRSLNDIRHSSISQ